MRTKCSYAGHLVLYQRWLKGKGVAISPDEMISDNLKAVFESIPTDVAAKRKHLDWLGEYVNEHLLAEGAGDSTRKVATAAIRGFYEANDAALVGHWKVAEQKPVAPPPAVCAGDVRKVHLAMPVRTRTRLRKLNLT